MQAHLISIYFYKINYKIIHNNLLFIETLLFHWRTFYSLLIN